MIDGEPNCRNAAALRIEERGILVQELRDLLGFSALHCVEETLRLVHAARIIDAVRPKKVAGSDPRRGSDLASE